MRPKAGWKDGELRYIVPGRLEPERARRRLRWEAAAVALLVLAAATPIALVLVAMLRP